MRKSGPLAHTASPGSRQEPSLPPAECADSCRFLGAALALGCQAGVHLRHIPAA